MFDRVLNTPLGGLAMLQYYIILMTNQSSQKEVKNINKIIILLLTYQVQHLAKQNFYFSMHLMLPETERKNNFEKIKSNRNLIVATWIYGKQTPVQ